MRKFIVSDLHGNGNLYDSIINYLSNLKKVITDDITLFINGDLIDRGINSASMLLDVRNRMNNKKDFKIEYLAGNHEAMMYKALRNYRGDSLPLDFNWMYRNGGNITIDTLKILVNDRELIDIVEFISNLKLYHKFDEVMNKKNIVLVHAKCPTIVEDNCPYTIRDIDKIGDDILWARKDYRTVNFLGNQNYFTIVGHTPVGDRRGFTYDSYDNVLNIDGGCSCYVVGQHEYDHVPLVEITNNDIKILTFNNNNEIVCGNHIENDTIISMNNSELSEHKILTKK